MVYALLTFLHVASMFAATALAIGPIALFVRILRTGDVALIRRTFHLAEPLSRAGGVCYGLGVVFGVSTALDGGISLTTHWLLAAYAALGLLILANFYADRWMKRVERAANASPAIPSAELAAWISSSRPLWSLAASGAITLAIVFVMVVKPDLLP